MLALISCRNAVLKAAASWPVSGGTSRVLVRPGADAFAITAMPHELPAETQACAEFIPCLARLPMTRTRFADVGCDDVAHRNLVRTATRLRARGMRNHAVVNAGTKVLFPKDSFGFGERAQARKRRCIPAAHRAGKSFT